MRFRLLILTLGGVAPLVGGRAFGEVAEFFDRDEWIAAVGQFTTADFTGFPHGMFVTDQYSDLGVQFTDGNDSIFVNENAFPNDGDPILTRYCHQLLS